MGYIKKRVASFGYAFTGIYNAFKAEHNFRVHLFTVFVVSAAGFYFKIPKAEWCLVIICFGVVVATEMLNTAIEKLCDALIPEQNPKIKFIKDVSAGAVLIVSIAAGIIGLIIFLDDILGLFFK